MRIMKIKKWVLALLLVMGIGVGCATVQTASDPRVLFTGTAARNLELISINYGTGVTGAMQIQLELMNRKNSPLEFRHKVTWMKGGTVLYDALGDTWMPDSATPQGVCTIRETSPKRTADGFRIQIDAR